MTDNSDTFKDPSLAINRVYTRKGDTGLTRLVGGQRTYKDTPRINAYGTLDELNAHLGMTILFLESEEKPEIFSHLKKILEIVQHQLFNLGSLLATLPEDVGPQMPRIRGEDVEWLERKIDQFNKDLPPLRSFVLPGGTKSGASLHLCRTVARRAERIIVQLSHTDSLDPNIIAYTNRLSDAFFVWSRWVVVKAGKNEILWQPNAVDLDQ